MTLKIIKTDNAVVFAIQAKIYGRDHSDEISGHVKEYISCGERNFVFDLSKVQAINSIGVGILMSSWTRITNAQGKLRLTGLNRKVREILKICEIDQIISISNNLTNAIKHFN